MVNSRRHCPVSRAMDVVGDPSIVLILRELAHGGLTISALGQRLPDLPEAELASRLRHLVRHGLLANVHSEAGRHDVRLTDSGQAATTLVDTFGAWGQRWLPEPNLAQVDVDVVLGDICREADRSLLPVPRTVVQLEFLDIEPPQRRWLVFSRLTAEATSIPPVGAPRVFVRTTAATLAQIWLGETDWYDAILCGAVSTAGEDNADLDAAVSWIGASPYADLARQHTTSHPHRPWSG